MAGTVDPKLIEQALNDLDFPASKERIVTHVEQTGGSAEALRAVRSLPLADYSNVAEILRSFPLSD
jgi:Protein of unknown function (DUF2795)